jgi:hypothetical protein
MHNAASNQLILSGVSADCGLEGRWLYRSDAPGEKANPRQRTNLPGKLQVTNHKPPVYPEITEAQWAVLSAWTDQRCAHMMDAADFIADLSPEARSFLLGADKEKIKALNNNMDFFANSKAVWRFLWIGGGIVVAFMVAIAQAWKTFGDIFTIKIK